MHRSTIFKRGSTLVSEGRIVGTMELSIPVDDLGH